MEVGGGETLEQQIARRLEAKSEYSVIRGTSVLILFLGMWSLNLWVFKLARLDTYCIYPEKLTGDHLQSIHEPGVSGALAVTP
jgi:hypothetical protein